MSAPLPPLPVIPDDQFTWDVPASVLGYLSSDELRIIAIGHPDEKVREFCFDLYVERLRAKS